jgi:hypothetical protein
LSHTVQRLPRYERKGTNFDRDTFKKGLAQHQANEKEKTKPQNQKIEDATETPDEISKEGLANPSYA